MRNLTIYRYYFTASDCYNESEPQEQTGVQVHCTVKGAPYLRRWVGPDDGRLGKNRYSNYHNRPGGDVCANAYIGKLADGTVACYQALPWNYRCWLSASGTNGNANRMGYIGFEIACDAMTDEAYFREAVMGVSVNLTAYLCVQHTAPLGTAPTAVLKTFKQGNALAVMDHHELAKLKLASGHADISHWLKKFGLTMDDYRKAVEEAIEEGVEVTYVDVVDSTRRTLRKGSKGADVEHLQQLLNADPRYPTKVDGIFGGDTESSVRAFQADNGLKADGVVGPATWAKLDEVEADEDGEEKPEEAPQEPSEESSGTSPLTIEERLTRLERAVFGQEGGESDG